MECHLYSPEKYVLLVLNLAVRILLQCVAKYVYIPVRVFLAASGILGVVCISLRNEMLYWSQIWHRALFFLSLSSTYKQIT